MDIETTGLNKQVETDLGPQLWNEISERLAKVPSTGDLHVDSLARAEVFKGVSPYKYFDNIGLAQFVTHRRQSPGTNQPGMPPWGHGGGYTTWEDGFEKTLHSKSFVISEFSRRKGIINRSLEAALTGDAKQEWEVLSDFSKQLITNTARGRQVTVRGWNVWFDVWATQSFLSRHAGAIGAAGIDPFAMFSKDNKGKALFKVESMEEHYFDMLTWKGWQNQEWAKKNLRFGRMMAAKHNARPGDPIPIEDHIARKMQGKGSLLRGRFGWKAEHLEEIFNRYGALDKALGKWQFPGGLKLHQLQAHDALRDIASEFEMSKRFIFTNRALEHYGNRWSKISKFFPGRSQEEVVGALAFARTGWLGQEFMAPKMTRHAPGVRGQEYLKYLSGDRSSEMFRRAGQLWGGIEAQAAPDHVPGMPAQKIKSPYGDYWRVLWDRDVSREIKGNVVNQIYDDIGSKFGDAVNAFKGLGWKSKLGLTAGAAYVLYNAFGRQQKTIDSNKPYNYQRGQQGNKVIDVPWSSPWEGIATDERSTTSMLAAGAISGAKWYAVYNSPALVGKMFGNEAMQSMYFGARALEDAMPFRIGRMMNISSYWSSYMTPEKGFDLAFKHLAYEDMALTAVGKHYAETLGVSNTQFLDAINKQKERGLTGLSHKKLSSNSPFVKIDLDDLGKFDVRMVEVTSRFGNAFGGMGKSSMQMRAISLEQQAKRASHILSDTIAPHEFGLGRRALRGLHSLFPGLVENAVNRWASVPQWDRNEFMDLQKSPAMAETPVWVPAYRKGDRVRAARGMARDYGMSGYNALRQQAAVFGIKMGGSRSLSGMAKGVAGAGLKISAAIGAFSVINNSLGGALTDPFYNLWERAMLTRASISDKTGLTKLREQMPGIQTTAAIGAVGVPLSFAALYRYKVRAGSLHSEYRGNVADPDNALWGRDPRGVGTSKREQSYRFAQAESSARIKNALYKPEMYDDYGEMLSARHYLNWNNLTKKGKGIVGSTIAATALLLPFLLGSKHSRDELEEIYGGNRNVEVKRGRWWELGATPYEGGRTHYYRRHHIARRKLRAEEEIPGGGSRGLGGLLKSVFDPYWREKEAYYDRPYPITGGTGLGEIPLIGPLLDATVGRFIKPPKLMHTDEWRAGDPYEQYSRSVAPKPGSGALPSPTPRDPMGLAAQVREGTYRSTELAGLRGYLTQAIGFRKYFGGDMPFEQAAMLEPSRLKPGTTDAFWSRDLGGMAGLNEIFRRLLPRPERGTEVNPLRNQMPSWLPGDDYFVNFKTGDPYNKIRYGGERLPGAGYAALNPEMEGVDPESYSAFHKYKILADVAPFSNQTRSMRGAAYAEARDNPARLEELDRMDLQVAQIRKKANFNDYSFLGRKDTVSGRVESVGADGSIKLSNYPHHTFTMAGLGYGQSEVADQLRRENNWSKSKATQRAYEHSQERQGFLQDLMVGSRVSVRINQGGMNAPNVEGAFTLKQSYASRLMVNRADINVNRLLIDEGYASNKGGPATTSSPLMKAYGSAVEAIGHLPQKIPGPWMTMTKFFNQADPMEDYRRDILYGSDSRFWNEPYENFISPYMHGAISKLTPGEYIPTHVEKRRDFDTYLDRIKFLKYAASEPHRTRRTMAGGDMYGDPELIQSALPHREKPFFEAFRQETDPRARKRILSMVSSDMQRALTGQWSQQYAATQGKSIRSSMDLSDTVQMAQGQLARMGRPKPPQGWEGSDPGIDWKDIKAVLVQNEGLDTHDFNIWDDRTQTLMRKPRVRGAVDELTSRGMPTHINSMASDVMRNMGYTIMPVETISHRLINSINVNNNVNYATWEEDQYRKRVDELRGR